MDVKVSKSKNKYFLSPVASKCDLKKGYKPKNAWYLEIDGMKISYSSIDPSQESKIGM